MTTPAWYNCPDCVEEDTERHDGPVTLCARHTPRLVTGTNYEALLDSIAEDVSLTDVDVTR